MQKQRIVKVEIQNFGRFVRQKRVRLNITDEALAEMCNRSDRNIRDIESSKREPKLGTALLLCRACEISTGELEQFVPEEEAAYV